jgi:AraC-like DNA-binding protein
VALSADLLEPELKAALDRAPFSMPLTPAHTELVELILSLTGEGAKDYVNVLQELVKAALWLYVRESLNLKLRVGAHAGVIGAVRGHIRAHLGERLGLSGLARAGGTNPAQLIRLFNRHANTTPMEFAWRERTLQGLRLLAGSDLSVNRIAGEVGFQTPFHFSARVKRETGVSPSEFRLRFRRGRPKSRRPATRPA